MTEPSMKPELDPPIAAAMTDPLHDLEAIRRLKYRFMRGMDTHDIELIGRCFAPDASVDFDDGRYAAEGRDQIIALFRSALTPDLVSSHRALHPEIDLDGPIRASGVWKMESTSYFPATGLRRQSAGFYSDEYVKADEWLIWRSGYKLSLNIRDDPPQQLD